MAPSQLQLGGRLPLSGKRVRSTYPGLDQQLPGHGEHAGETQRSTHCGDKEPSTTPFSPPNSCSVPSSSQVPETLRLCALTQKQQDPEEGDAGVEVGEIILPEV